MKPIFLFLLMFFAFNGFSQISPFLKTGIGYPYILFNDENIAPDFHTLKSFPMLAVEKPIPVEIRLKKRLSINPGIAYYFYKEHELKGDKTEGRDFKLNQHTINGYVKLLYQAKFAFPSEGFVYAGGIGGMHLITKTTGTKTVYGLTSEIPELTVEVNENGKPFFDMFYYGLVAGFQPNARKYNAVKVSFEVSWLPGFISYTDPIPLEEITDDTTVPYNYSDVGQIQFSVFLGFRKR